MKVEMQTDRDKTKCSLHEKDVGIGPAKLKLPKMVSSKHQTPKYNETGDQKQPCSKQRPKRTESWEGEQPVEVEVAIRAPFLESFALLPGAFHVPLAGVPACSVPKPELPH